MNVDRRKQVALMRGVLAFAEDQINGHAADEASTNYTKHSGPFDRITQQAAMLNEAAQLVAQARRLLDEAIKP